MSPVFEIPDFIKSTEMHLKSIDVLELINRIKVFRGLNIQHLNDQELFSAILDVLTWENNFQYCTNIRTLPPNTPFFRVRKLSGSIIPIENFNSYNDLWEAPPNNLTEYGRLNKPYESLLYTSLDPLVAIKETHISAGDFYAVIKYIAKNDIKVNFIGGEYNYNELGFTDKHAITVHEIYNNFLRDEFSRDVGKGTEFLYRVSERIAKDFFDLPPKDVQDAWGYSSIQDKCKYNICFRPEIAHDSLQVEGALICKKDETENIQVKCISLCKENEPMQFFTLGSPQQKMIFPEIQVI